MFKLVADKPFTLLNWYNETGYYLPELLITPDSMLEPAILINENNIQFIRDTKSKHKYRCYRIRYDAERNQILCYIGNSNSRHYIEEQFKLSFVKGVFYKKLNKNTFYVRYTAYKWHEIWTIEKLY